MPAIDLARVRSLVSLEQVLTLLGFVPSHRRGHRLRGPCPVHHSKNPCSRVFWADLETHRYGCFVCHSAGRQIDLWAAVHRLPVHTAAQDLCRRLGIPIPWLSPRQSSRTSK